MNTLLLKRLEYLALSSATEQELYSPTELQIADLLRHIRLHKELPKHLDEVEQFYSVYREYKNGILYIVDPLNRSLANCKGYGTDTDQAYLSYCENLAKQFTIVEGRDVITIAINGTQLNV